MSGGKFCFHKELWVYIIDLQMFMRELSLPGQKAAVVVFVAELVAEAVELETADADVGDADWVAYVRAAAVALRCPSAVFGALGGGDSCDEVAVAAETEVLWMTQTSAD